MELDEPVVKGIKGSMGGERLWHYLDQGLSRGLFLSGALLGAQE